MLLIMGQAGAGKSVQGELLVESHGFEWLSTGVILRAALNDSQVRLRMEEGDLLGDEMVEEIVATAIAGSAHPERIILDGFPRSRPQAEWLMTYLEGRGLTIDAVLLLDIDVETAMERLLKRGRTDDREEVVQHRFEEYQDVTLPIIDYFKMRGLPVHEIDGAGPVETVHARITDALGL